MEDRKQPEAIMFGLACAGLIVLLTLRCMLGAI